MMRFDGGPVLELLTPGRAPVEGIQEEVPPHLEQATGHDIVQHRHALEEGNVLEGCARCPSSATSKGLSWSILAVEDDAASLRMVEAADDVQKRGLSRPLGPMMATISPR